MKIKIKKYTKNEIKKCDHVHMSRREFIEKGIVTSTMAFAMPKILAGGLVKNAMGALPVCPSASASRTGGPLFFFAQGGMTVGAYFLSFLEADIVANSANAAARYGIRQTNITQLGPNLFISENSAFARGIRQAGLDLGYTAAQWNTLLRRCNAGFNNGPWSQDDGGGQNRGQNIALSGGLKSSFMNKAILFGSDSALASFSEGVAASRVGGNANPGQLAALYALTPAAGINEASMRASAETAHNLSSIFSSLLGMDKRTGASEAVTAATCGFLGDAPLTSANFGTQLFDPARIMDITTGPNRTANARVTARERAWLSAAYNANIGVTSGTNIEMGGFDYHGQSSQTIGNRAIEAARVFAMWLAAADAAKTRSTFTMVSNGQATADRVNLNQTVTSGGMTYTNVDVQGAITDGGGSHNKGVVVVYDPNGAPPAMKTQGSPDPDSGDWKAAAGDTISMRGLVATSLMALNRGTISDGQLRLLGLTSNDLRLVGLLR